MYKYDLHVHTSQTSPCASMSGAEQARAYKDLGFAGIVITDHYYDGFFEKNASPTWSESMDKYFAGYFDAKKEGDKIGLDVFQTAEVTLASLKLDYLVYGVDPNFFYKNEKLFNLSEKELIDLVHSAGGFVYAAHPFRGDKTECYPYGNIDGVEVINGNPLSNNILAMEYAKERNLLMCSGSDAHNKGDAGLGGITTNIKVKNEVHLAEVLKSGKIGFANTKTIRGRNL
ncbi:MAG: transposase [Clostridia bacterium]|nr:transposase [Clostridia bacterium]